MADQSIVTLDMAHAAFRQNPNQDTAKLYAHTALEYWFDDMIEDGTLLKILHEIREG